MKLIVTIPAYNEEKTIGKVIDEIPKRIKGIKSIEILVVNDGSTDNTETVARNHGASVLKLKHNGLAYAFKSGMGEAIKRGADIIVNTDADFQYNQKQIPDLIKPVLSGHADIVLGSRFRGHIEYMPLSKRLGNRLASWAVRRVSGLSVSDAQTGFRAFSREAALRMNIQTTYTYTQETILQAAANKLEVREIPVDFRKREGESRLISSLFSYARNASYTLIMGYLNYKPLRIFLSIGLLFFLIGFILGLRVLLHFISTGLVSPFIPTAILTSILLIFGFQIIVIGLLAEMIKQNRRLNEEILYKLKSK